jgi:hypothetical protein
MPLKNVRHTKRQHFADELPYPTIRAVHFIISSCKLIEKTNMKRRAGQSRGIIPK